MMSNKAEGPVKPLGDPSLVVGHGQSRQLLRVIQDLPNHLTARLGCLRVLRATGSGLQKGGEMARIRFR